jgi:aromatic ring hydroxylase
MLSGADGAAADERAAVFRMAWDLVGSSLADEASSTSASI